MTRLAAHKQARYNTPAVDKGEYMFSKFGGLLWPSYVWKLSWGEGGGKDRPQTQCLAIDMEEYITWFQDSAVCFGFHVWKPS